MKIKELWIEDYKLLQDFNTTFDEQLIVLIGQNGSGKSTLLEFVANIFYDLYEHFVLGKGSKPEFDFKLRYKIEYSENKYEIYITSNKKTKEYYEINIKRNDEKSKKYSKSQINQEFYSDYKDMLPQNVVMYYSGISETLENKFKVFQEEYFIKPSVKNSKKIEQPFFYFLPENFSTILTALLAYQYRVPEILKEQFAIDGFDKIIITLKKPYWAKDTIENAWGASGDLLTFIERMINILGDISHYKITDDNIIFTIPSQEKLINIWEFYGEEKSIFEYLTTLQANDLIENIEVMINKDEKIISHNNLSEGEKQLLTILGLKELLATENTLFLLDEPDTYLHPKWQRDFVNELLKLENNNQFITTTHSPLILGHLKKKYLKIIKNGKIDESIHYSYGRDINSILLDLMGVTKRPQELEEKVSALFSALELDDLTEAKKLLSELTEYFGAEDNIIIEANTILSILED
ncbi:MAG: Unknown protein [uncultured Sulfurovum sp.]|uniref:Endonuclease GajA/Old nuclease/RecF-like AAA domain-containing protein n=1 Tax=uncultured Sulfurovum sp. TaxID=269237 RepID=A0A6S6SMI4_9BACT|nr:MAG: Unknown protein [uncultured Sulfurovum sp.]